MASFVENRVTGRRKDGTKYIKAEYIQLVESYRVKGKKHPRQKVIWKANKKKLEDAGWFDKMVLWFAARSKDFKAVDTKAEFIKKTAQWGLPEAVRNILEEIGYLKKIRDLDKKSKRQFSLEDVVVGYVTISFLESCSKLRYFREGQEKIFGESRSKLHQVYRAVRALSEVELFDLEGLKRRWGMYKPPVEMMLFDFTTVYWESVKSDGFRERGYSKDGKEEEVQIMMAMVTDDRGLPVTMELFEGNASERVAIKEFVESLGKDLDIRQIVFVGDAGMYSKDFVKQLRDMGWNVIIKVPRNALTSEEKRQIQSEDGWEVMEADQETGEVHKEIKEIGRDDNYRLIAVKNHALKRLQEEQFNDFLRDLGLLDEKGNLRLDNIDRKELRKKLKGFTRRYTKGIIEVKGEKVKIDQERIKEIRSWFGISVFLTDTNWRADKVVKRYGLLRQIEARWRDLKSGLSVRPVYHWTEKSIKGHFVLKFMALHVAAYMEQKINDAGLRMTWRGAVDRLQDVKAVKIEFADGKVGWVRTEASDKETLQLMRVLGVPTDKVMLWTEDKEAPS